MDSKAQSIAQNIVQVFINIYNVLILPVVQAIPQGALQFLLIGAILAILLGLIVYAGTRPKPGESRSTQVLTYRGPYDSLALARKGIQDYLNQKDVQASLNNWVLLNFAPLTVRNAGYLGPDKDGMYDTMAIRQALELGFRCFVFHIDYYEGSPKDSSLFVAPGEPCLLHRDNQGVIRSANCGKINEMMKALAESAFSSSLPTGNDPLIVILDFKNTPDRIKSPKGYADFLSKVSEQLVPIQTSLLTTLGGSKFFGLQNQNQLFTQNFQSLRGKTLLFTNANTDVFTQPEIVDKLDKNKNLRLKLHAQIFVLSGDKLYMDPVTDIAPKGTVMAMGRQTDSYFLSTPPDKLQDAQLKTNNVFTLINPSDAYTNINLDDSTKLLTTYGAQIIPFTLYESPQMTESFFKTWGPYSWKLKPKPIQYIVTRTEPPKVLSPMANANQGNVAPPALNLSV